MASDLRSSAFAKSSCPCHLFVDGRSVKWRDRGRRIVSGSSRAASLNNENLKGGEDVSRATLIWRAIKLPIYSVAFVPLTVGGSAAYWQTGVFSPQRYFVLLVSSIFIITWLNLSNDVYDFDTGADKKKKESVVNLAGRSPGSSLFITCPWHHWAHLDISSCRKFACNISPWLCNSLWLCLSVPTFPVKLPRTGRASVLCSIWSFCHNSFLLLAGKHKRKELASCNQFHSFCISPCRLHNKLNSSLQPLPSGGRR